MVNSKTDKLETDKLQILRITDTDPSVSNQPHKVIQKHWNEISDGVYISIVHFGSQNIAIIQRTSSGNYGSILYWRYGFSEPAMYSCSNGVWS